MTRSENALYENAICLLAVVDRVRRIDVPAEARHDVGLFGAHRGEHRKHFQRPAKSVAIP